MTKSSTAATLELPSTRADSEIAWSLQIVAPSARLIA